MHVPFAATTSSASAPGLIGVDWGTSSCRAYLMDEGGRILASADAVKGILQVEGRAFAETLDGLIGPWRRPGLPVLLSGMIGSRQGWIEAPYVPVPASFKAIAEALVRHPEDDDIHIVPGLAQDLPEQAPDVMRGEETQIIGAVSEAKQGAGDRQLMVMPGTHSKWVLVEDRQIVWFATFMTGELFAVLKDHSILGRLMVTGDNGQDQGAFAQGLDAARSLPGGLLQHLFSARTLGLFDRLSGHDVAGYLSGLLIGHELEDALGQLTGSTGLPPITVIGASSLAGRYLTAFDHAGLQADKAGDDVAACGQMRIARAAKLLPSSMEPSA